MAKGKIEGEETKRTTKQGQAKKEGEKGTEHEDNGSSGEKAADNVEPNPDKNLIYYWKEFRKRPIKTIGLVFTAFIIAILLGAQDFVSEHAKNALNGVCKKYEIDWCSAIDADEDQDVAIVISTATDHCISGRIAFKFRDWQPAIDIENGADRLVVCADVDILGKRSNIVEKLDEQLSACLTAKQIDEKITISTKLDSPAICRAEFRFNGRNIEKTTLEKGWYVCMPGYEREQSRETYTNYGISVPKCSEEALRAFGFIPN